MKNTSEKLSAKLTRSYMGCFKSTSMRYKFLLLLTVSFFYSLIVFSQNKDSVIVINGETFDKTFIKVEKEAEFKGGSQAWLKFLNKNLNCPDAAIDNNVQGDVIIEFLVDTLGKVSEVKIIEDPGSGLGKAAAKVIKQSSGQWEPAMQNGRRIKSHKRQPFQF